MVIFSKKLIILFMNFFGFGQNKGKSIKDGQEYFHEEAETFNLGVTLSEEKLLITLKDYIDWVIY